MITRDDLEQAIAECQGERHPTASTCVKLAAYLTLKRELFESPEPTYSFAASPPGADSDIHIDSDSEFARAVEGRSPDDVWPVIDELMDTLSVVNPRLYAAVLRKL